MFVFNIFSLVFPQTVAYFCKVFFMVLDLWLGVKIGCRETTIPIYICMWRQHIFSVISENGETRRAGSLHILLIIEIFNVKIY
jgi:hypothetical protein